MLQLLLLFKYEKIAHNCYEILKKQGKDCWFLTGYLNGLCIWCFVFLSIYLRFTYFMCEKYQKKKKNNTASHLQSKQLDKGWLNCFLFFFSRQFCSFCFSANILTSAWKEIKEAFFFVFKFYIYNCLFVFVKI